METLSPYLLIIIGIIIILIGAYYPKRIYVTPNIIRGKEITDYSIIVKLAQQRKSVILYNRFGFFCVRPAAFIQNWNLRVIARFKIYHSIKK